MQSTRMFSTCDEDELCGARRGASDHGPAQHLAQRHCLQEPVVRPHTCGWCGTLPLISSVTDMSFFPGRNVPQGLRHAVVMVTQRRVTHSTDKFGQSALGHNRGLATHELDMAQPGWEQLTKPANMHT